MNSSYQDSKEDHAYSTNQQDQDSQDGNSVPNEESTSGGQKSQTQAAQEENCDVIANIVSRPVRPCDTRSLECLGITDSAEPCNSPRMLGTAWKDPCSSLRNSTGRKVFFSSAKQECPSISDLQCQASPDYAPMPNLKSQLSQGSDPMLSVQEQVSKGGASSNSQQNQVSQGDDSSPSHQQQVSWGCAFSPSQYKQLLEECASWPCQKKQVSQYSASTPSQQKEASQYPASSLNQEKEISQYSASSASMQKQIEKTSASSNSQQQTELSHQSIDGFSQSEAPPQTSTAKSDPNNVCGSPMWPCNIPGPAYFGPMDCANPCYPPWMMGMPSMDPCLPGQPCFYGDMAYSSPRYGCPSMMNCINPVAPLMCGPPNCRFHPSPEVMPACVKRCNDDCAVPKRTNSMAVISGRTEKIIMEEEQKRQVQAERRAARDRSQVTNMRSSFSEVLANPMPPSSVARFDGDTGSCSNPLNGNGAYNRFNDFDKYASDKVEKQEVLSEITNVSGKSMGAEVPIRRRFCPAYRQSSCFDDFVVEPDDVHLDEVYDYDDEIYDCRGQTDSKTDTRNARQSCSSMYEMACLPSPVEKRKAASAGKLPQAPEQGKDLTKYRSFSSQPSPRATQSNLIQQVPLPTRGQGTKPLEKADLDRAIRDLVDSIEKGVGVLSQRLLEAKGLEQVVESPATEVVSNKPKWIQTLGRFFGIKTKATTAVQTDGDPTAQPLVEHMALAPGRNLNRFSGLGPNYMGPNYMYTRGLGGGAPIRQPSRSLAERMEFNVQAELSNGSLILTPRTSYNQQVNTAVNQETSYLSSSGGPPIQQQSNSFANQQVSSVNQEPSYLSSSGGPSTKQDILVSRQPSIKTLAERREISTKHAYKGPPVDLTPTTSGSEDVIIIHEGPEFKRKSSDKQEAKKNVSKSSLSAEWKPSKRSLEQIKSDLFIRSCTKSQERVGKCTEVSSKLENRLHMQDRKSGKKKIKTKKSDKGSKEEKKEKKKKEKKNKKKKKTGPSLYGFKEEQPMGSQSESNAYTSEEERVLRVVNPPNTLVQTGVRTETGFQNAEGTSNYGTNMMVGCPAGSPYFPTNTFQTTGFRGPCGTENSLKNCKGIPFCVPYCRQRLSVTGCGTTGTRFQNTDYSSTADRTCRTTRAPCGSACYYSATTAEAAGTRLQKANEGSIVVGVPSGSRQGKGSRVKSDIQSVASTTSTVSSLSHSQVSENMSVSGSQMSVTGSQMSLNGSQMSVIGSQMSVIGSQMSMSAQNVKVPLPTVVITRPSRPSGAKAPYEDEKARISAKYTQESKKERSSSSPRRRSSSSKRRSPGSSKRRRQSSSPRRNSEKKDKRAGSREQEANSNSNVKRKSRKSSPSHERVTDYLEQTQFQPYEISTYAIAQPQFPQYQFVTGDVADVTAQTQNADCSLQQQRQSVQRSLPRYQSVAVDTRQNQLPPYQFVTDQIAQTRLPPYQIVTGVTAQTQLQNSDSSLQEPRQRRESAQRGSSRYQVVANEKPQLRFRISENGLQEQGEMGESAERISPLYQTVTNEIAQTQFSPYQLATGDTMHNQFQPYQYVSNDTGQTQLQNSDYSIQEQGKGRKSAIRSSTPFQIVTDETEQVQFPPYQVVTDQTGQRQRRKSVQRSSTPFQIVTDETGHIGFPPYQTVTDETEQVHFPSDQVVSDQTGRKQRRKSARRSPTPFQIATDETEQTGFPSYQVVTDKMGQTHLVPYQSATDKTGQTEFPSYQIVTDDTGQTQLVPYRSLTDETNDTEFPPYQIVTDEYGRTQIVPYQYVMDETGQILLQYADDSSPGEKPADIIVPAVNIIRPSRPKTPLPYLKAKAKLPDIEDIHYRAKHAGRSKHPTAEKEKLDWAKLLSASKLSDRRNAINLDWRYLAVENTELDKPEGKSKGERSKRKKDDHEDTRDHKKRHDDRKKRDGDRSKHADDRKTRHDGHKTHHNDHKTSHDTSRSNSKHKLKHKEDKSHKKPESGRKNRNLNSSAFSEFQRGTDSGAPSKHSDPQVVAIDKEELFNKSPRAPDRCSIDRDQQSMSRETPMKINLGNSNSTKKSRFTSSTADKLTPGGDVRFAYPSSARFDAPPSRTLNASKHRGVYMQSFQSAWSSYPSNGERKVHGFASFSMTKPL